MNTISLQAHRKELDFWDRDVKQYIHFKRITKYNPINEYLESLPTGDGKDHTNRLTDTFPTEIHIGIFAFIAGFSEWLPSGKG